MKVHLRVVDATLLPHTLMNPNQATEKAFLLTKAQNSYFNLIS